jgi:UDP-2,3-diacylglucosamine hydrolase
MPQIVILSDFHLGVPNIQQSRIREIKICNFLDSIKEITTEIFLVGDIFDFWFEYNTVVPKGYYRLFGKLAELSDKGIKLHFFKGNHDMWMRNLFIEELNADVHGKPIQIERFGKNIYIGHGDGLGPGDGKYKFLKHFFSSSLCQWLFRWIHPDIGMKIAMYFSYKSRFGHPVEREKYLGNDKEWLYVYCENLLQSMNVDCFIFGHRHLPIYTHIGPNSVQYINLGDWLDFNTYAILDESGVHLKQFESEKTNRDFDPNAHTSSSI